MTMSLMNRDDLVVSPDVHPQESDWQGKMLGFLGHLFADDAKGKPAGVPLIEQAYLRVS